METSVWLWSPDMCALFSIQLSRGKKKTSKTIKRQLKKFNCLKDLRINYDFKKTVYYANYEIVKVKYAMKNCRLAP